MRKLGHRTLTSLLAALVLLAGSLVGIAQPAVQSASSPDPAGWEIFPTAATGTIYTVDMLSSTDGWAGGMAGFILHYTGGDWVSVQTNFDSPINGIHMLSASSGWGVTYKGQVIRYDGSWFVHSTPASASLDDVFMLSETDGWAVGGPVLIGSSLVGTILRYNAGSNSWQQVSCPSPNWLLGIDMLSASDGWIVGVGGTVLRWNGTAWQGGSIAPGLGLNHLDAGTATDVWAVGYEAGGGGVLYHWNGSAWSRLASPNGAKLNAVQMVSSTYGWAVGDGGTILRYDGSSWQPVASPTTAAIYTLDMVSCAEGWAFTQGTKILHYNGIPADLSTSRKRVDHLYAAPGDRLTYTITTRNSGDCDAGGVQVTDAVPPNTSYVTSSATTTQGTIQEPTPTEPLRVQVGTIAPQDVVTITFQVDVGDTGQTCWFVLNKAIVGLGGAEWTPGTVTTIGTCNHMYVPLMFKR
jgi:uncharacterized repeat protein (TIGR01451 family)